MALAHNHSPSLEPSRDSTLCRVDSTDQVRQVSTDAHTCIRALETLAHIKEIAPDTSLVRQDVFDERQHAVKASIDGKMRIQNILEALATDFVVNFPVNSQRCVTHFLFALVDALGIYRSDPFAILQD